MRRFRSRRFAMLLILMLTLSMALQGVATVSFADQDGLEPLMEGEEEVIDVQGRPTPTPQTYKVDYHKGGGDGISGSAPPDEEYAEEVEFIIQDNGTLEREGYTFLGWHTDDGGPLNDADLIPGDSFTMPHNAVNFFPRWQEMPKTYNVFYDGNGNTGGSVPVDSGEYLEGAPVTVMDEGDLVKLGFTFSGWKLGKHIYNPGESFEMDDRDATLKAQWMKIELDPSIEIEKLVKEVGSDGDFAHEITLSKLPATVQYKITVTNTGNVDLKNVQVIDEKLPGSPFMIGNLDAMSEPVVLELISKDFAYGDGFPDENTAEVQAQYSEDSIGIFCEPGEKPEILTISTTDSAIVDFEADPGISINKMVKLNGSDLAPVDELIINGMPASVVYHFTIENIGNVKLYDIYVSDNRLFDGSKMLGIDLEPGATYEFDQSFLVDTLDDNQQFINWAVACGYLEGQVRDAQIETTNGAICSLEDSATVTYVDSSVPAVMIDKSVDVTSVRSGRTVNYTLMVTNTGNVTLYQLIVTDPLLGFSQTIESLAPGASITLPAIPKTLTTGDRNSGSNFVNTASVTGNTCPLVYDVTPALIQEQECVIVSDTDDVTVAITRRTGGGGGTTTITPEVVPEAVPEVVPEPAPVVEPAPAPEPAPVIVEEVTPLGVPVLPKTAELPVELFYGLGGMLTALGAYLKRR